MIAMVSQHPIAKPGSLPSETARTTRQDHRPTNNRYVEHISRVAFLYTRVLRAGVPNSNPRIKRPTHPTSGNATKESTHAPTKKRATQTPHELPRNSHPWIENQTSIRDRRRLTFCQPRFIPGCETITQQAETKRHAATNTTQLAAKRASFQRKKDRRQFITGKQNS